MIVDLDVIRRLPRYQGERRPCPHRRHAEREGDQDPEASVHRERRDRRAGEDAEQHHQRDEPALPGHDAVEPTQLRVRRRRRQYR